MMRGKFITVEGIEGAGKSTVVDYIEDYLSSSLADTKIISTREPGGTEVAESIRNILLMHLPGTEEILAETELLLMFAGRVQHISHCIMPALVSGHWIVCDRYIDATYAYQGGGRKIDLTFIRSLDRQIVGQLYPDLTLLLDVPVKVGMERAEGRLTKKDRIENEAFEFFENVRSVYLERAKQEPNRIKVIATNCELDAVYAKVRSILDEFISRKT